MTMLRMLNYNAKGFTRGLCMNIGDVLKSSDDEQRVSGSKVKDKVPALHAEP